MSIYLLGFAARSPQSLRNPFSSARRWLHGSGCTVSRAMCLCCGPQSCWGGGWEDEWYRGKEVYSPRMSNEPAYTCCGVVPLGMIRERFGDEFRVTSYSYDYEYTLPLCLQLALCPRGAAHTTYGVEPGADMSCCAHLFINLGCCCVQMKVGQPPCCMRMWPCCWRWRYVDTASKTAVAPEPAVTA